LLLNIYWLFLIGFCQTAIEAMNYFGFMRSKKVKGVTFPSQKRYIKYFHDAYNGLIINSNPIIIKEFRIKNPPEYKEKIYIKIKNTNSDNLVIL